jgi:hypothetical protein
VRIPITEYIWLRAFGTPPKSLHSIGTSEALESLYGISAVLNKGEELLIALKSLKKMLRNMMSGLMQIDLPMNPKFEP